MKDRDWNFTIGDIGDPMADIQDWMLRPYPSCLPDWIKHGKLNGDNHERENNHE
jgi:hypothetical protein